MREGTRFGIFSRLTCGDPCRTRNRLPPLESCQPRAFAWVNGALEAGSHVVLLLPQAYGMTTISRFFTSLALCATATGLAVSLTVTGKVIVMYEPRIGEALEFANPATFLSTMAGEAKPFFNQFAGSQKSPVAGAPVPADSAPQGTVRTAPQSGKSHRRHPRS